MQISSIMPFFSSEKSRLAPLQKKSSIEITSQNETPQITKAYYLPLNFGRRFIYAEELLQELGQEYSEKWVFNGERNVPIKNENALNKLKVMDEMTECEKYYFTKDFCKITGFPDFNKIADVMNNELQNSLSKLEETMQHKVLFAAYDSNCSLGKKLALPGSDADGMFVIIDKINDPFEQGEMRYLISKNVNKRIINITQSYLPEVFSVEQIREFLNISEKSYERMQKDLKPSDFERFEKNLSYDGKDFVKAAEFNILLGKYTPKIEDKWNLCSLGMLVELLRDGAILRNSLDEDTLNLIKGSKLYKYSNIMRQNGLKEINKSKLKHRKHIPPIKDEFKIEEHFQLIKSILFASLGVQDKNPDNAKYFKNLDSEGLSTIQEGNIFDMYAMIRGQK